MAGKRQRTKARNKREIKLVLVLLGLSLVALLVLVVFDSGIVSSIKNIGQKQTPIVIRGECYDMMNTVLYQINNSDDCQKQCSDNCWVLKKSYKSSEFIPTPGSCNLCDCYCK